MKWKTTASNWKKKEAEDTLHKQSDTDYTDDIVLLANIPTQPEILQHDLKRAAACIGLNVNALKIEYMCLNQRGDIFTLNISSLKLVNKFTDLESSVSSTETSINMQLAKEWTAVDRLSVIRKPNLTEKIKRSLFQAAVVSICSMNAQYRR